MRELLTVQDGEGKDQNGTSTANGDSVGEKENGDMPDEAPLVEEEVEGIRQRTAAFLLGEGRYTIRYFLCVAVGSEQQLLRL